MGVENVSSYAGFPSTQGRMFVTDKFYTRHVLEEKVRRLTEDELMTMVTVSLKKVTQLTDMK